jgi:cytochrome d ubiquinol oxidase subunit I
LPAALQARFEEHSAVLGYALLLKRYVDDPRRATEAQIRQAAHDTIPQVAPLFWSFRVMVALGIYFIVLTATFFVLSARRRLDAHRWLLRLAVWSIPLPWIAAEAGWLVAELGRQPWAIEGVLPTAVAVSNLGIQSVLATLLGFVVLYTILIVVEMKLMLKAIRKGPEPEPAQPPSATIPAHAAAPRASLATAE